MCKVDVIIKHRFSQFNFSLLSFVFVSIEKICQTLNTVFDHSKFATSKFVKNTELRVVFSTLFSVFKIMVKDGLSCSSIISETVFSANPVSCYERCVAPTRSSDGQRLYDQCAIPSCSVRTLSNSFP